MISENMQKSLNDQINKEFYSAYVYLSMAAQAAHVGLKGFASWFRAQYEEEIGHGMKIFDYMIDQNAPVKLQAINAPSAGFESPLAVFEKVLKHEQDVTKCIYDLMDLALKERDHATHALLEWFATEQVEEEATAQEVIDRLRLIGKDGSGMFILDLEMGKRAAAGGGEEAGEE